MFTSNGTGTFSGTGTCTLSGSGNSASCSVTYTPTAVAGTGTHQITATYVPTDGVHLTSNGSTTVTVTDIVDP